jgi:bis(5'-nucleosidyl)-tetraphosphatase
VKEETGLTDVAYPFGEDYKETIPYGSNKIARYYLAETAEHAIELPVSTALGRPEHHEFRWVSFEEAEELLPPRLTVVLEWARNRLAGH